MVRLTRQACAQIGRLATPTPDKLGVTVEDKAKDFFREVGWFHLLLLPLIRHTVNHTPLSRPRKLALSLLLDTPARLLSKPHLCS